jgi:hypothetical protein
MLNKK